MRYITTRPVFTASLLGVCVFLFVGGLWFLGTFQPAELWIYDRLVKWRAGDGTTDPRIVLIMLDDQDIGKYDYPLRDSKLAALLSSIEQDQPRAVGLDLYRDLPEPRDGSELGLLNAVLARYPNIVSIFLYGGLVEPFGIRPPAILAAAPDRIGFNNFATDSRTVRRGIIFFPHDYASLAWQLALLYLAPLGVGPSTQGDSVRLGRSTFARFSSNEGGYAGAPSAGYQFLFDFNGPRNFTTYSVDQALTEKPSGAFRDKIVLIGGDSESAADFFITPLGLSQPVPGEKRSLSGIPGVLIHAQSVNQFLRAALDGDSPTTGLPLGEELTLLFGWCALATGIGYFCHSFWSFAGALAGCLLVLFGSAALLFLHHVWVASAGPGLAIVLAAVGAKAYTAQIETRNRAAVMRLFSRHLSSDVAKSIWEQRDEFVEGNRPKAQKLTATVLFTDLKNYSSISEKLGPDELMQWINECLGALARHVDHNGGFINKYIGDSIMAVFGAPAPRTTPEAIREDAIHAVRCAWEMKAEIKRLNAGWETRGLARVGLRIGIYTGELMAGTVGHADRLEYTVIGDSVNTASRLESVDKESASGADAECRILIGEPTFVLVKESFEVELMGSTQFKGQTRMSPFYRIVGPKTEVA